MFVKIPNSSQLKSKCQVDDCLCRLKDIRKGIRQSNVSNEDLQRQIDELVRIVEAMAGKNNG